MPLHDRGSLSGEKDENNLQGLALYIGHWPLALAAEPFRPISLNMCFVVHASVGHWPVDIVWHSSWGLPLCSWAWEMALGSGVLHGHTSDKWCYLVYALDCHV